MHYQDQRNQPRMRHSSERFNADEAIVATDHFRLGRKSNQDEPHSLEDDERDAWWSRMLEE
jgi:hypothetical protein